MAETALVLRRFGGRCINVLEAITTISEAEESARRLKAEAIAAAKAAEAAAAAEGKAAIEAAARKAASELAELRAKSDEKAREDARQLASDTENKKAAMRARADARLARPRRSSWKG